MARILITSGPTRQYLDPVRYLTNASSGQMGVALTQSAIQAGHEVIVVSGPVHVQYPAAARRIDVETTQQMLAACLNEFSKCDGAIAAAAPCDFQPTQVASDKIKKTGEPLRLELTETPDVVGTMGQQKKSHQWIVGFALETSNEVARARQKLQRKRCDLIVLNSPTAINSDRIAAQVIGREGRVLLTAEGPKPEIATRLLQLIQTELIAS
jgi:phosphopantothenoylcysteine decarboxylase/phosphopantothenate--cysteine ligase